MLTGVVPWVNNSISHQFGVCLSLGCLGHTAGQLGASDVAVFAQVMSQVVRLMGKMVRTGKEEGRGTYNKNPAAHNPPATMNDKG